MTPIPWATYLASGIISDWFAHFFPAIFLEWQLQRTRYGNHAPSFPEWLGIVRTDYVEGYMQWQSAHQTPIITMS